MSGSRPPGRPIGAEKFGREKIVNGLRSLVREGWQDISRKDLAERLGITPALITYYFPSGNIGLISDALCGVFDEWIDRLQAIDPSKRNTSAEQTVDIIKDFFRTELHLEDLSRSMARKGLISSAPLDKMEALLVEAVKTSLEPDEQTDPVLLAQLIWGACKQCAAVGIPDLPTKVLVRLLRSQR